ncbi:MAG: DUF1428 domain-containing protein [Roseitalea sp.]|nr:DUF1428 domain-containing protein [Roseitalea sp.]MBO6720569.1 DUF1428 domain-containing protein [Roseitalea sp.]
MDVLVASVPGANRKAFVRHAETAASVFKTNGAVSAHFCWGENVPDGDVTSLPLAVRCEEGETVVFAWVVWPSEDARAVGMPRAFGDSRMQARYSPIPYDPVRAVHGMFVPVVEA